MRRPRNNGHELGQGGRKVVEDQIKRNIKFEYIDLKDHYKQEKINEDGLVSAIKSLDPRITFMVICYSQINELYFLFESTGCFPESRINRDLNILSNGNILTMDTTQKEFIQKLAHTDHTKKDVVITGPVGSGKTILGLEAINIKYSYYYKKKEIKSRECQNKLRVIIVIRASDENMLKEQLMKSKNLKFCNPEIQTELIIPDSQKLTTFLHAKKNYKSYIRTIIMIDEINR